MSCDTVFAGFPTLLTLRCSSVLRYYEGSDSCPLHLGAGLPAYLTQTSRHSVSNHVNDPDVALHATTTSASDVFQASPPPSGLAVIAAESSSLYYGLPVRFRLLSTPHHCDAVTFSYGVLAYSDMDLHHAVCAPSRAH